MAGGTASRSATSNASQVALLSVSMPPTEEVYGDARLTPWLWGLLPDSADVLSRWGRDFGVSVLVFRHGEPLVMADGDAKALLNVPVLDGTEPLILEADITKFPVVEPNLRELDRMTAEVAAVFTGAGTINIRETALGKLPASLPLRPLYSRTSRVENLTARSFCWEPESCSAPLVL